MEEEEDDSTGWNSTFHGDHQSSSILLNDSSHRGCTWAREVEKGDGTREGAGKTGKLRRECEWKGRTWSDRLTEFVVVAAAEGHGKGRGEVDECGKDAVRGLLVFAWRVGGMDTCFLIMKLYNFSTSNFLSLLHQWKIYMMNFELKISDKPFQTGNWQAVMWGWSWSKHFNLLRDGTERTDPSAISKSCQLESRDGQYFAFACQSKWAFHIKTEYEFRLLWGKLKQGIILDKFS